MPDYAQECNQIEGDRSVGRGLKRARAPRGRRSSHYNTPGDKGATSPLEVILGGDLSERGEGESRVAEPNNQSRRRRLNWTEKNQHRLVWSKGRSREKVRKHRREQSACDLRD